MGAAGLDNVLIFSFQTGQGGSQLVNSGDDLTLQHGNGSNVHGRGEGIVGGLGHIDVIIGVQQLLADDLITPVGDDLIGVHVGLRAGAGLPHDQREVIVQLAADHLVAGLRDCGQLLVRQLLGLQGMVSHSGSLLQDAESVNNLSRHCLDAYADGEIFMRTLGLGAPVPISRYLDLTHRIVFNTIFHWLVSFVSIVLN